MRTKPCLKSADAKKIMAACLAETEKNNWKVTIAIVDDGAALISLERIDGAPAISATVAPGEAKTSALTKQPTKFWEDRVKERPAFANFPAGLLRRGRFVDRGKTPLASKRTDTPVWQSKCWKCNEIDISGGVAQGKRTLLIPVA
jgi:hypothetical protein